MALSIESIYKPVSEFFINKFRSTPENSLFFRFDKFGSVISDDDFIDPEDPDNKTFAREAFSDVTNRLPVLEADGINISFSGSSIDMEYNRFLNAAIPFAKTEDPDRESILNTFSQIKADALREWNNQSLSRGDGIASLYRPSLANPTDWYDKDNGIWTKQSFEIKATTNVEVDSGKKSIFWKYKVSDPDLVRIMPSLKNQGPIEPIRLRKDVILNQKIIRGVESPPGILILNHRIKSSLVKMNTVFRPPGLVIDEQRTVQPETLPVQNLKRGLKRLDVSNRLAVLHAIREIAPTKPSNTSNLSISFEYCLVNIHRHWFMDSIIRHKSWYIPGTSKGELSKTNEQVNFSALPIGFVAIKNLVIEANWSKVEVEGSKNATDFGPFEVNTEIINNKLSHEGIQIIGWVLQKMPDLPPIDPPH